MDVGGHPLTPPSPNYGLGAGSNARWKLYAARSQLQLTASLGLMAKDMRTQLTSPHSIPTSQEPAAAARQPFFLKNPAGWDVGVEFGDVGCVRISFAINSNPFSANSH